MLKKKLKKSTHPLRDDIQLCLLDLLDDGDEESGESTEWIQLIDRGGLTLVNNTTFEILWSMSFVSTYIREVHTTWIGSPVRLETMGMCSSCGQ